MKAAALITVLGLLSATNAFTAAWCYEERHDYLLLLAAANVLACVVALVLTVHQAVDARAHELLDRPDRPTATL